MRAEDGAGDAQRFRRLYRQHYAAIHGFAYRRLLDRGSAADAAAEVFLVAWRRLDQIPAPELGWLFGVAHRVVLATNRADRRVTAAALEEAGSIANAVETADRYEAWEELRRVAAAVDRLSPADRQVLLLVAWEELSGAELATALGCSRGAAAVRLHRARTRLRSELELPRPAVDRASVARLKGSGE